MIAMLFSLHGERFKNNFHIELERKLSGEYHARVWGFFDDVTLEYIPSDITYNGEILYRKVEKIK